MPDVRPTFADEVDAMLMAEREPPDYTMAASCVTCGVEMLTKPAIAKDGSLMWDATDGEVIWQCPSCPSVVKVRVR
jgi:hypothetical protein